MARLLQTLPLLVSVTSGQDSESYTYTSKDFKVLHFCVAYTKCIATLWGHLIYLFVHESRTPVMWSSVVAILIVNVVSSFTNNTPYYCTSQTTVNTREYLIMEIRGSSVGGGEGGVDCRVCIKITGTLQKRVLNPFLEIYLCSNSQEKITDSQFWIF